MSSNWFKWAYPTSIRLGAGCISVLPDACAESGIRKPLLVTDRNLAKLPVTERALDLLEAGGMGRSVYSDVDPNPNEQNLDRGVALFLEGNFDGVVAFGGGSAIDLAKMIAFMARQTRPVWEFEDVGDLWKRADAGVIYPCVAVPTTAGTGSEVGRASVITNSTTRTKKVIFHPRVLPSQVIADPELTVSMPRHITAGTGMDAFAHCLEAFCSGQFHPMSQGIALEGMKLVKENLLTAYKHGHDIDARLKMMSAASMGAVAFQKGLGAIHAISHPVGSLYDKHHGTTNAVIMPFVIEFNRPAIESRIAEVASYLGISGGFDGFLAYVIELREELGIPANLSEFGIGSDELERITTEAIKDPTAGGNPIQLMQDNTLDLVRSCF